MSFNPETYWETDGTRNGKKIFCPANAYGDCPYCDQEGKCRIADPIEECDDFTSYFESWEEYDNIPDIPDVPDDVDETGYDPYLGCYTEDC